MADHVSSPLLDLIKSQNLLDDLQVDEVTQEHIRNGKPIGEILADFGLIDGDMQLQIIANHLGTEVVTIGDIQPDTLKAIPADAARMYRCIPISVTTAIRRTAFRTSSRNLARTAISQKKLRKLTPLAMSRPSPTKHPSSVS
jgi:hypothetical protein